MADDEAMSKGIFYRLKDADDEKLFNFASLLENKSKLTRLLLSLRRSEDIDINTFSKFMSVAETCKNI